jgi:hypothetical protein
MTLLSKLNQMGENSQISPTSQHPIPSPSSPMQYRAIGLVRGYYKPSRSKLTRGMLVTPDGAAIEAVLLGRIMSVIKNHLDLEKIHLWVVYPHTRPSDDQLQLQIAGVWEPETLAKESKSQLIPAESLPSDYFSVRGEVVFYSQETEKVIIKIKQSPRNTGEKEKLFKLKLQGILSEKPLHHFWDLEVKLEGNNLVIQKKTDLGRIPISKKIIKKPKFSPEDQKPKNSLASPKKSRLKKTKPIPSSDRK